MAMSPVVWYMVHTSGFNPSRLNFLPVSPGEFLPSCPTKWECPATTCASEDSKKCPGFEAAAVVVAEGFWSDSFGKNRGRNQSYSLTARLLRSSPDTELNLQKKLRAGRKRRSPAIFFSLRKRRSPGIFFLFQERPLLTIYINSSALRYFSR